MEHGGHLKCTTTVSPTGLPQMRSGSFVCAIPAGLPSSSDIQATSFAVPTSPAVLNIGTDAIPDKNQAYGFEDPNSCTSVKPHMCSSALLQIHTSAPPGHLRLWTIPRVRDEP